MADLQFQDFHPTRVESFTATQAADDDGTTYEFQHSEMDRQKLLPSEEGETPGSKMGPSRQDASFFSFDYYQRLFDVDTDQVLNRIFHGMIPRFGKNFITEHIRPFPDLYGPFWVCVTLVFTTAICGNLSTYLHSGDIDENQYEYDFQMVTVAATVICCYVVLVPAALHALFWYRRSAVDYSYLEILCCYGYALSVFIPVSMLWLINIETVRWAVIVVAVVMSGLVLVFTFWPAVQHEPKMIASGVILAIFLCHFVLAIGFKGYFFASSGAVIHSTQLTPPAENDTTPSTVPANPIVSETESKRPQSAAMRLKKPDIKPSLNSEEKKPSNNGTPDAKTDKKGTFAFNRPNKKIKKT